MKAEDLQKHKQSLALEQAYAMVGTQLVQVLLENEDLKTKQQELTKNLSVLAAENSALNQNNTALIDENALLKEQILFLQQQLFGKKSEAGEPIIDVGESTNDTGEPQETITVSTHTRKKGKKHKKVGRKIDTSALLRHKIYHRLPDEQQLCPCCNNQLSKIGEDISEQLEVLPMRLYVAEHIRDKYACRTCEKLIMAPKPKAPLPKALAGGSLLTEIIINKYQYHLPLYRQSKIFGSYNAIIPDNTLGNWVMQAGGQLILKLLDVMWKALLLNRYLQVDETPVKLLEPNKKGYVWTYFAPITKLVIFEVSSTRSGKVAEKRLANFKGLLQTDGYSGYDNLRKRKDIEGFGCLTHARRKFKAVLKITNNANGIAAEFVARVQPLYDLEARMRELNLHHRVKKRLRQKQAFPIFKALHPWLKQQLKVVLPKSKLGKAIKYTLKQWKYITKYLRHGMVEIDTNWVENKIRELAIGRRNWLFMDNEDSGAINAFWFSLIASAMLNGLNPRIYIHFLLMHIHELRQGLIEPVSILPNTIDKSLLEKFANEHIAIGKEILNSS